MLRRAFQFSRARSPGKLFGARRGLLTSSYSKGPSEVHRLLHSDSDSVAQFALKMKNLLTLSLRKASITPIDIPQHFKSIVDKYGDRPAVISRSQGQRLSYLELDHQSNALAHGLKGVGVKKGDRVAVSLGNNVELRQSHMLYSNLGPYSSRLNPAFSATQITSALTHLSAAHFIIGTETSLPYKSPRENITLLKQIIPDLTTKKLESESVPSLCNLILVDNSSSRVDTSPLKATTPFAELLSSSNGLHSVSPDTSLNPDDIVNIQFTSGTTSMPKAAALSHHSILNNGYLIGERMGLTPSDIVCCPPPLFHCFGCILGYMATATHGTAILFPSEAFNPKATLLSVQEEGATALYGVATMFVAELELLQNGTVPYTGFDKLRTGIAAGSSVPSQLMEKLHNTLNLTGLTICYGMTETSPVSCMTTPDDPLQKRLDSVGKLMPHVEAKVVDISDPSKILPVGEKGELMVSGYLVMKGYWGDEERTKEVRVVEKDKYGNEKIWMHTGDEATMDSEGYVKITGRIKDLIIRGGENIHPLEVENVLFAHENIAEASVVGLPDEKYGECVAAFVVVHKGVIVGRDDAGNGLASVDETVTSGSKHLTATDVREWVRSKLSNHLVPKYVFWIEDYPKTASGKIQKFKLKDEGIKLLRNTGR